LSLHLRFVTSAPLIRRGVNPAPIPLALVAELVDALP
jgi:hypothetical protein